MEISKTSVELANDFNNAFKKAVKAFSDFLIKSFEEVKEQDKILSELLGKMHHCSSDDFDPVDLCRTYSFLMNITPASRKNRENDFRKGGDEV